MSKKDKKKKAGYQQVGEEEWIQMQDFKPPPNQLQSSNSPIKQDKQHSPYTQNLQNNKPTKTSDKPQKLDKKDNGNYSDKLRQNQKENKIVAIQKKQPKKIKKPSIPMMFVTCDYCTVVQNVPGNTQVFCCGSCQNMNQCEPLYGVFICGCCQSKVCYGFGTSILIKCTKCSSVNRVPSEASKKYESLPKNPPPRPKIIPPEIPIEKVQFFHEQHLDLYERQRQSGLRKEQFNEEQNSRVSRQQSQKQQLKDSSFQYPGI